MGFAQAVYVQQASGCVSCGAAFPQDAVFCPHCGRRRQDADGAEPSKQQGSLGLVASPRPFLQLEALVCLVGHWLDVHFFLLAALMLVKGALFRYPGGWRIAELFLLLVSFVLQRLQQRMVSHGNRAQNAAALGAYLALTAPVLLLVGYFMRLQIYVLQAEFIVGI